jgi:hypothetical protein
MAPIQQLLAEWGPFFSPNPKPFSTGQVGQFINKGFAQRRCPTLKAAIIDRISMISSFRAFSKK